MTKTIFAPAFNKEALDILHEISNYPQFHSFVYSLDENTYEHIFMTVFETDNSRAYDFYKVRLDATYPGHAFDISVAEDGITRILRKLQLMIKEARP